MYIYTQKAMIPHTSPFRSPKLAPARSYTVTSFSLCGSPQTCWYMNSEDQTQWCLFVCACVFF